MARIDIRSNGGGSVAEGVLQLENGVALDTTLRSVTDQNNTTSPLKLSTTAVQVNSPLRITTSDASGFYLDAEDSATNNRFSIKRDPSSQEVTLDFASNPAGSTTLVGAIRTYQDGVNLSNAMSFIEDGSVGIGTNTPVGILHIKKTSANTRLAIDGDAGFNRLISYRTGAVQRFGLYVNNTVESGSNAGSDFAVRAYSDAGTLLSTPLFIKRSTGNIGIGTTSPSARLQIASIQTGSATTANIDVTQTGNIPSGTLSTPIALSINGTYTDINTASNTRFAPFLRVNPFIAATTVSLSDSVPRTLIDFSPSMNITSPNDINGTTRIVGITSSFTARNINNITGIYYNPTLSFTGSISGHKAIETVSGDVVFNSTSGNTLIGVTPSNTAKLSIKGSGSTSATTSLLVQNSSSVTALQVRDDRVVIMPGLPTSPVGLPSGAIWNNLGILNIV
jgi:hypothetical protein